jgi:tetratricopeptide (TPR) repeat protein
MNAHYQKAIHLLQISRPGEAEKELREGLVEDPQDHRSQALLGLCLSLQKRPEEAVREAEAAVKGSPEDPTCHFMHAQVLHNTERHAEALAAIREALRSNPHDADFLHVLSLTHYAQKDWKEALEAAEEGLRADPEHVDCHLDQAKALAKLGRRSEAVSNAASAIRLDPERAESHAAQGWAYLEQNKTAEAMQCFREALRIEPNMEYARQGILHAMRARNPLYALMLQYFLWMSKLKNKLQWRVILGAYLLYQGILALGRNFPALKPYTTPVVIAYVVFVIFSWIAVPFFNLILRLDKFGRMALHEDEIRASNKIGATLLACAASFTAYGIWHGILWMNLGFFYLLLLIPMAGSFQCPLGTARKRAYILVGILGLVGFAGAILHGTTGNTLWLVYIGGVFLSSILFNVIMQRS